MAVSAKAQVDANPYNYPTKLNGGYRIVYKEDSEFQHIYLTKGRRTISELGTVSEGLPHKNLGYVGADFSEFFVLVRSYGSGNPHEIELIRKSNGKNLLKGNAFWIDVDEKENVLLYCEKGVPSRKDNLILLNVRTGAKRYLLFPPNMFGEPEVLGRIEITKIKSRQISIKFSIVDGAVIRSFKW